MENRSGLIMDILVTLASGTAERDGALTMLDRRQTARKRVTLGGDKGYDTRAFVEELRQREVTPHVTQNTSNRRSAIDRRTTRHAGYEISQRKRKLIEECFGWMKTVGHFRQTRHRGTARVGWCFTFLGAAYNLVRMRRLLAPPVCAANA